jgi:hypothetical protein
MLFFVYLRRHKFANLLIQLPFENKRYDRRQMNQDISTTIEDRCIISNCSSRRYRDGLCPWHYSQRNRQRPNCVCCQRQPQLANMSFCHSCAQRHGPHRIRL